jgi:ATP-dependent DNA ligase
MPIATRRLHPHGFVAPCLPTPAHVVPEGEQWAHEVKHDGYRMICRRDGDRVRIFSRNAVDWTDRVTTSTFENLKGDPTIGCSEGLRRAMLAHLNDTSNPRNA